jgi:hypothetical protein
VERVNDVEWAFRTLGADQAWLFRYHGGLVDCWLEKGPEKSPEILQTVGLGKELELRGGKDRSVGFKSGLIFVKRSSQQGKDTLEISHWAVVANGTTIGKTTVVPIPYQNTRTVFLVGPPNARRAPAELMRWSFESQSVPWPELRLMCGRPRS